jgi:hypothetical protein
MNNIPWPYEYKVRAVHKETKFLKSASPEDAAQSFAGVPVKEAKPENGWDVIVSYSHMHRYYKHADN